MKAHADPEARTYGARHIQRLTGWGRRQVLERARQGRIPGIIADVHGEPYLPYVFSKAIVDRWLDGESGT